MKRCYTIFVFVMSLMIFGGCGEIAEQLKMLSGGFYSVNVDSKGKISDVIDSKGKLVEGQLNISKEIIEQYKKITDTDKDIKNAKLKNVIADNGEVVRCDIVHENVSYTLDKYVNNTEKQKEIEDKYYIANYSSISGKIEYGRFVNASVDGKIIIAGFDNKTLLNGKEIGENYKNITGEIVGAKVINGTIIEAFSFNNSNTKEISEVSNKEKLVNDGYISEGRIMNGTLIDGFIPAGTLNASLNEKTLLNGKEIGKDYTQIEGNKTVDIVVKNGVIVKGCIIDPKTNETIHIIGNADFSTKKADKINGTIVNGAMIGGYTLDNKTVLADFNNDTILNEELKTGKFLNGIIINAEVKDGIIVDGIFTDKETNKTSEISNAQKTVKDGNLTQSNVEIINGTVPVLYTEKGKIENATLNKKTLINNNEIGETYKDISGNITGNIIVKDNVIIGANFIDLQNVTKIIGNNDTKSNNASSVNGTLISGNFAGYTLNGTTIFAGFDSGTLIDGVKKDRYTTAAIDNVDIRNTEIINGVIVSGYIYDKGALKHVVSHKNQSRTDFSGKIEGGKIHSSTLMNFRDPFGNMIYLGIEPGTTVLHDTQIIDPMDVSDALLIEGVAENGILKSATIYDKGSKSEKFLFLCTLAKKASGILLDKGAIEGNTNVTFDNSTIVNTNDTNKQNTLKIADTKANLLGVKDHLKIGIKKGEFDSVTFDKGIITFDDQNTTADNFFVTNTVTYDLGFNLTDAYMAEDGIKVSYDIKNGTVNGGEMKIGDKYEILESSSGTNNNTDLYYINSTHQIEITDIRSAELVNIERNNTTGKLIKGVLLNPRGSTQNTDNILGNVQKSNTTINQTTGEYKMEYDSTVDSVTISKAQPAQP